MVIFFMFISIITAGIGTCIIFCKTIGKKLSGKHQLDETAIF